MKIVAALPGAEPVPAGIRRAQQQVSRDGLRQAVRQLAQPRVYGTPGNEAVRQMLCGSFSELADPATDAVGNVIVGDPAQAQILIGAHYDAVPGSPGADDNASALAVLLAAARAIGPRDRVCYVAFNGEECGFIGSRHLVERTRPARLEHVHILEMLGYTDHRPSSQRNPVPPLEAPTVADFLGLAASYPSRHLLDRVLRSASHAAIPVYGLYLPDVPLEALYAQAPHVFRSDHTAFWEAGLPALMWTDTAEFRNPHYHQPTDTPETLNYEFMAEVARLLIHVVLSALD